MSVMTGAASMPINPLSRLSGSQPFAAAALAIAAQIACAHPGSPAHLRSESYQRVDHFLKLPAGRSMGSTSAVTADAHGHIWVADRCGTNSCEGSSLDPIM